MEFHQFLLPYWPTAFHYNTLLRVMYDDGVDDDGCPIPMRTTMIDMISEMLADVQSVWIDRADEHD